MGQNWIVNVRFCVNSCKIEHAIGCNCIVHCIVISLHLICIILCCIFAHTLNFIVLSRSLCTHNCAHTNHTLIALTLPYTHTNHTHTLIIHTHSLALHTHTFHPLLSYTYTFSLLLSPQKKGSKSLVGFCEVDLIQKRLVLLCRGGAYPLCEGLKRLYSTLNQGKRGRERGKSKP